MKDMIEKGQQKGQEVLEKGQEVLGKGSEALEKGFYTAIGAGIVVIEGAQEMISDLVARGKLAPEEGRKYIDDLRARMEAETELMRQRLMESVQRQAKNIDLVTMEDAERMNLRLDELETRVALVEAKVVEITAETKP